MVKAGGTLEYSLFSPMRLRFTSGLDNHTRYVFQKYIYWRYKDVIVCVIITYSKGKDQPGKVADRALGQLNKENEYFLVPVHA